MECPVFREYQDLTVLGEIEEIEEDKDVRGKRETPDFRELKVTVEQKDPQGRKEIEAPGDKMDLLGKRDQTGKLVTKENKEVLQQKKTQGGRERRERRETQLLPVQFLPPTGNNASGKTMMAWTAVNSR